MKLLLIVLFLCIFIVFEMVRNNIPVVRKVKINCPELRGIKIVQLSDLHRKKFGQLNSRLISRIRRISPSLIVMTGDMVSRSETDAEPLTALIHASEKICPVYYVLGNHEIDMKNDDFQKLMDIFQHSTAALLKNQTADISVNGKTIHITGLCYERENFRNRNGGFSCLKPYGINDMTDSVGFKPDDGIYTILLAHNPLYFDTYASWGADLVLSGHVHGGIIRLPFIGGILSPERKLFPKYSAGIYRKDNTVMYVNCGLGKFRILNPPEISLIEFE